MVKFSVSALKRAKKVHKMKGGSKRDRELRELGLLSGPTAAPVAAPAPPSMKTTGRKKKRRKVGFVKSLGRRMSRMAKSPQGRKFRRALKKEAKDMALLFVREAVKGDVSSAGEKVKQRAIERGDEALKGLGHCKSCPKKGKKLSAAKKLMKLRGSKSMRL